MKYYEAINGPDSKLWKAEVVKEHQRMIDSGLGFMLCGTKSTKNHRPGTSHAKRLSESSHHQARSPKMK
jgi:hypothetical protein